MEGLDGDWDAKRKDGKVHGGITALFRLGAVAPRLRELVLDEFLLELDEAQFDAPPESPFRAHQIGRAHV